MDVRPIAESQDKFAKRAAAASPEYGKGVANAGPKWLAGAQASEDAWAQGTQDAVANRRFGAGVRKAGASKYQDRAAKLGPDRYRTGVAEGAGEWGKGFAPHAQAMQAIDLGVKGMRGSEQNYNRSRTVGQALRAKKLELLGQR
jgi:hypothetical protein